MNSHPSRQLPEAPPSMELRSENTRRFIGQIPPRVMRCGTLLITLIVLALCWAAYTLPYPLSIDAVGQMRGTDTLSVRVAYRYLYLFDCPRQAEVLFEGGVLPSYRCTITGVDATLRIENGENYFEAKVYIPTDSVQAVSGQKAEVRLLVNDLSFGQQVFRQTP